MGAANGRESGPEVRIFLLGRFEVRVGDAVAIDRSWSRRKARALVKLLAVQPTRALHREQVQDALWPDLDADAAANNLHKSLHHIRSALSERGVTGSVVSLAADLVGLAPDVWIDAEAFRRRAQRARDGAGEPDLYERALALYAGDLLPEDIYEDWPAAPREELRTLRLRLLFELSQLLAARGQLEAAAERLQQVLLADPLNEDAHVSLMRLYASAGSRHRALRQYRFCRSALERELGVEPSPETEATYRAILDGRFTPAPESQPPVAVAARPPMSRPTPVRRPPAPPVYGRERQLELAEELLDAVRTGRGQALFVRGVAGVGKSRFAQHVLAMAEAAGALPLVGRSYELEAAVSYQAARDMLAQALQTAAVDDAPVRRILHRSLYLRRLLPEAGTEGPAGADPATLQLELFREVVQLFGALAASRGPLLLLFDDLHAADEASLRLLHALCRQLPEQATFVLATYRTDESTSARALAQLVGSLRREHLAHEVELAPLSEATMRLVVADLFDGQPVETDLVREIVRQAEGNPLFAGEIVHTMREEGSARFADGRWQRRAAGAAPVPGAVQELVERRLERLGDAARQVVHVAAVLGREADYGLLRRTVPLPEAEVLDGLDECINAYLLEEAADGYRYRHTLLREAVYRRLTRARRQQLHRTVAMALEEWDAGQTAAADAAELIGHHFAESDEPWRAVPHLQAAGRRAAQVFANEQAVALFERAAAILRARPARAEPRLLASLLEELGDLVRRLGDAARSAALFDEAAALLAESGAGDDVHRVRGKAALSHITLGDVQTAADLLGQTLEAMTERSAKSVVARTYYLLAQLHWHSGQHHQALEAAERALVEAEHAGDAGQRARAYEVLALACHSLGDWQKGVEYELGRQATGLPGFDTDEAFDAHL